jgi:hypothetical protein
MTTEEALDLALAALKLNNDEWKSLADSGDCGYWNAEDQDHYKQTNEAITAIKQARALDKKAENARELGLDYEPDYKVTVVDDQHPKGVPLEQWGSPAPVQEPWKYRRWDDAKEQWELTDDSGWPSEPVYTTPPAAQRQFVGLTDEEADNFLKAVWGREVTPKHFIQAIEAKLKEKNT